LEFETAASARVPAIAYCQGTPLRNESLSCGREQKAQGAEHIGDGMDASQPMNDCKGPEGG